MLEKVLYLALTLENPGVSPGTLRDMFQDPAIQNMTATTRLSTKLCKIVYPWESVSEIQPIKESV